MRAVQFGISLAPNIADISKLHELAPGRQKGIEKLMLVELLNA